MKRIVLIVTACLALTGCATYYRVTDPNTGKAYYTQKITKRSSGAVSFKDSRTGGEVTLQSSDITKVNKEEYTYGGTKPVSRNANGRWIYKEQSTDSDRDQDDDDSED